MHEPIEMTAPYVPLREDELDRLIDTALIALMHDPAVPTGMRPLLLGGEELMIRERTDAESIVRAVLNAVLTKLPADVEIRSGS
ncbi:hypothetical protein [Microbacterium maritypicum]|uniref:hypothetical protein n=1 Tax=Microbacterium maritypicum TaxID=33918 RepID=UPI0037FDC5EA